MRSRLAIAAAALVVAAGCGSSSAPGNAASSSPKQITVFAAASLTDAFAAAASAYDKATGTRVRLSFAGSQDLVAQVNNGAPADAVATADSATIDKLEPARAGDVRVFARNRLVVVVARGNPKHIVRLSDLARRGVVLVIAGPTVPAGKYAVTMLAAAHVQAKPKSLEDNVRSVLTKVELGEADAGIVYITDATSAGSKVTTVPVADSPVATYPAVALSAAGRGFVDFLTSAPAQAILAAHGFLPPS